MVFPILRRRFAASAHHGGPVPFNEPGGVLFGKEKSSDMTQKIYIAAYLGGLAAFAFLWQFKPDTSSESWARGEAIKRMKERGVDLSSINL